MENPINAIGAITCNVNGEVTFLGTGFCYKACDFILTAAHVIPENAQQVIVTFPYAMKALIATKIARHDTSDTAALACANYHIDNSEFRTNRDLSGIEFFSSISKSLSLAEDYITYGYPEDMSLSSSPKPTPRLFKGYIQRLLTYKSHNSYSYSAMELSTPCPSGLSGAPIMLYGKAHTLAGLVTENIEIGTESHEEITETQNGEKSNYIYKRVINYGVAARLGEIEDWIDEHHNERNK